MFTTWAANAVTELLQDRDRSYFVPEEIRERLVWLVDNVAIAKDTFYDDALKQVELGTTLAFLQGFFNEAVEEAQTNLDRMRGSYINKNKFTDEFTKTGKPVTKSDTLLDAEMATDEKFVKARLDLAAKKRFQTITDRVLWALKDRALLIDLFARKDR